MVRQKPEYFFIVNEKIKCDKKYYNDKYILIESDRGYYNKTHILEEEDKIEGSRYEVNRVDKVIFPKSAYNTSLI